MKEDTHPTEMAQQPKSSAFAMFVVLGMVGTAAGFVMYTKRTGAMLKQMERVATQQEKRRTPRKFGPSTKEEWDKIRPRFDKDELV
jgi:hypothetical protein